MSDTDTNTEQTESCSTTSDSGNKFTTVKTIYARAAVVLLALNFCLTGYVVLNINETTQQQLNDIQEQTETTPTIRSTASEQSGSQTRTLDSREKPQVKTLEK